MYGLRYFLFFFRIRDHHFALNIGDIYWLLPIAQLVFTICIVFVMWFFGFLLLSKIQK